MPDMSSANAGFTKYVITESVTKKIHKYVQLSTINKSLDNNTDNL